MDCWIVTTILATALTQAADRDKDGPVIVGPVAKAVRSLPEVEPTAMEAGDDLHALTIHLERIEKARDGKAEASEIEALLAWMSTREVNDNFMISLGLRCPALSDEELLVLSSWPTVKLTVQGYVRPPSSTALEIRFEEPKNVLRFVPLTRSALAKANR